MKKSDLKKVLKPIIKECIRESLYEEGLLKSIVSQVVEGYSQGVTPITEVSTPTEKRDDTEDTKKMKMKLDETKRKMLTAIGQDAYGGVNVFEGTTPMRGTDPASGNVMEGVEPGDSGVDISSLMNNRWGKLI